MSEKGTTRGGSPRETSSLNEVQFYYSRETKKRTLSLRVMKRSLTGTKTCLRE
jgi:hypothetical protein